MLVKKNAQVSQLLPQKQYSTTVKPYNRKLIYKWKKRLKFALYFKRIETEFVFGLGPQAPR